MDTHITAHPTLEADDAPLSAARLPGEIGPAPDRDGAADAAPITPGAEQRLPTFESSPPRRRRGTLLLGVAVVALAAAAASAFLVSPYNHVYPVPQMASAARQMAVKAGISHPSPVAPSAANANVILPPPTPAPVRERFVATPKGDQVNEVIAAYHGGPAGAPHPSSGVPDAASPASTAQQAHADELPFRLAVADSPLASAHASVAANPPDTAALARVSHEPGAAAVHALAGPGRAAQEITAKGGEPALQDDASPPPPAPVAHDATSSVLAAIVPPRVEAPLASAPPPTAFVPAPPLTVTVTAPPPALDVIAVARNLRPGPMTPPDQIEVISMVSEMAAMVRDLRVQDAQLRDDIKKATADNIARLDDYGRRLSLSEARAAMAAARAAGNEAPASGSASAAALPTSASHSPIVLTRAEAALPPPKAANGTPLKRYRVQAASPGLALLAQVDRGGEGAQIQVMVGDMLPGYGRVKSIDQRGTAWAIATENGTIQ